VVVVDRSKSSSSNKAIICTTWDMDVGVFVPVLLRQAKVNDANCITMSAGANQDVARFDIPVNEMARMNIF
jgi:hypothetical protein